MTSEKQQRKITITTRTFLRVKRPRHLDPLATLCLDLSSQQQQQQTQGKNKRHRKSGPENDKTVEDLSQLMHQSTYVSAMQQHNQASKNDTPPKPPSSSPPSTLVWKRVSDASKSSNATSASTHHLNSNNHSNKRIRYVDARLDTDNENDANGVITPKRRRLALTLLQPESSSSSSTSTPPTHNLSLAGSSSSVADKKKKKSLSSPTKQNAILDPLSRLVDDSLQSVIAGTKQICEHLDFITTDSRLEDMTQQQSQSKKWLCWSTKRMKHGGGTILHAAALYNDLSSTTRILSMAASFSPTAQPKRNNSSSSSSSSTILEVLLKEKDTDGRTPYKIAKIIGHERIIQALDAYGAMEYEKEELEKQKKEEEEGDFVYDVFCLQEEEEIMGGDKQQDQHPQTTTNNTNYATTESTCTDMATTKMAISTTNPKVVNVPEVVELRGGIGYWDEHGELVLEAVGDEYDMDDDNDSTLEDDDVDSNCEDHDGNDYPDEDELFDEDDWAEGIIRNDDDSSNDDGDANEYRHRPVYMNGGDSNLAIRNITNVMGGGTGFGGTAATHGDDDEDDNDYYNNIDTEYDLYDNDGQQGNRMYAYDPEFDHGDDGYNSCVE